MRSSFFPGLIACLFLLFSCVKPKIYRAELAARSASEAREKVLLHEMADRKKEAAALIKQLGDLSKTVGMQENELATLHTELSNRIAMMGASANKLAEEKMQVEKELASKNGQLAEREETLQRIREIQNKRRKSVTDLDAAMAKAYVPFAESGVTVNVENETVLLSLPDKLLFDANGLTVSASGKNVLAPLAEYLAAHPSLDVDVVAYTDNVLPPKEKTLKDTWEWSLQRATNLTRLLIREYNTNANQLTPVGRGEFYPLTSNETAEGRQKNRRTVFALRPVLPGIPSAE